MEVGKSRRRGKESDSELLCPEDPSTVPLSYGAGIVSSCCGGRQEVEGMLGVVDSQMVSIVKAQSNKPEWQNTKNYTAWLKDAARSLEMCQLVDRGWISSNIWRLPELPLSKEQDYHSKKGRSDNLIQNWIRLVAGSWGGRSPGL
ncbi:hypothetical protein DPMN_132849 [Dreissena polymorpha]|uniref:Uncharacterized protein n=1 Tax=Dreissena polymorpha TaxID=45954 RepID=A0A9D4JE80_DREPO|nr:hypothetical protein DPMN_132849 [Dreissena polymorpha]